MILYLRFLLSLSFACYITSNTQTVFDYIYKHLEVRQKYSTTRRISSFFSVFGNVVKRGLSCLMYC